MQESSSLLSTSQFELPPKFRINAQIKRLPHHKSKRNDRLEGRVWTIPDGAMYAIIETLLQTWRDHGEKAL